MSDDPTRDDLVHLRRSIALAAHARARGDRPFGAVIVGADGDILAEAGSTQGASRGGTLAHAELNALHCLLQAGYDRPTRAAATLYAAAEPCAMCAAATLYSGVGRIVYGLGTPAVTELRRRYPHQSGLALSCRAVLATATHPVAVVGPCLESEAAIPHMGYWTETAA